MGYAKNYHGYPPSHYTKFGHYTRFGGFQVVFIMLFFTFSFFTLRAGPRLRPLRQSLRAPLLEKGLKFWGKN